MKLTPCAGEVLANQPANNLRRRDILFGAERLECFFLAGSIKTVSRAVFCSMVLVTTDVDMCIVL